MTLPLGPGAPVAPADPSICSCCQDAKTAVRQDILAWWEPSPGWGYGPDGRLISLCEECIKTLQFFVEIGSTKPNFNG